MEPPAPVRPGRRRAWATVGVPLLCGAVMLGIAAVGLGRHGAMGNDEVATRWAAQLPPHLLVRLLSHLDAVHGAYYALMHGWVQVAGPGITTLRVPSVIAMSGGVAAVADLTRRVTSSAVAALAAGLVAAATPSTTYYAQTARSYAAVLACVVVLTSVLVRALQTESRRRAPTTDRPRTWPWWTAYAGLLTLAGYLNEMALLVLAAHAVTVVASRQGRAAAHWLAAALVGTALVAPLLVVSAHQTDALDYLTRPGWGDVRSLWQAYFGLSVPVAVGLSVLAVVAVVPTLRTPRRPLPGHDAEHRRVVGPATVGLPLAVLPAALLLIESALGRPLYQERYVLWGVAGTTLLAGSGFARLLGWAAASRPALRPALGPLAVLLGAVVLVLQLGPQHEIRTPGSRRFDFGVPARVIAARSRPGDGVLFFGPFYRKVRLGYPEAFAGVRDLALARSPAKAGNYHGREAPLATVRRRILTRQRVWTVGRAPSRRTGRPGSRAESAELTRYFDEVDVTRSRNVVVTLWRRRAPPVRAAATP